MQIRVFAAVIVLLLVDQGIKGGVLTFFPQWVLCNKGGLWGISIPVSWLVFLATGILCGVAAVMLYAQRQYIPGLLCVLVGGCSNVWDRIVRGCVVDFVAIASFPVFNGADVFLCVGGALLLFALWKEYQGKTETAGI